MLSELPDTARGRQRPGDGAGGCERSAGDCVRGVHARGKHVRAVHVVAQQLLPCAVSPSSVAKPVRASKSASRSVTKTLPQRRWP